MNNLTYNSNEKPCRNIPAGFLHAAFFLQTPCCLLNMITTSWNLCMLLPPISTVDFRIILILRGSCSMFIECGLHNICFPQMRFQQIYIPFLLIMLINLLITHSCQLFFNSISILLHSFPVLLLALFCPEFFSFSIGGHGNP